LLSVSCAISSVTYTTHVQAKTVKSSAHIGKWQNKDEDGDGVLDEQDDYPFDATKTTMSVVQEQEFNNNVSQANSVGNIPFAVKGVISLSSDIDDFKFTVTEAEN